MGYIYRRNRNRLRTLVNQKHKDYIRTSFDTLSENPKRFWGLVRFKYKNKVVPDLLKLHDKTESSPLGKARLLNRFFHSNFTTDEHTVLPDINSFTNSDLAELSLTVPEVRLILQTLDSSKAVGSDTPPA